jgi:hypothetical protein
VNVKKSLSKSDWSGYYAINYLLFNVKDQTMKKIIISAFILFAALNTGTALAGSCPMVMKQIDLAIDKSTMSMTEMDKVKTLRIEGEKLHTSGDHSASVDALNKAKDLLGI